MQKQPNIIISTADLAEIEIQLEHSKLPSEYKCALEKELDRTKIVESKDLPDNVAGYCQVIADTSNCEIIYA